MEMDIRILLPLIPTKLDICLLLVKLDNLQLLIPPIQVYLPLMGDLIPTRV